MNIEYTFLNTFEYKYFSEQFDDIAGDQTAIPAESLKEIVFNYNKFNKTLTNNSLNSFLKSIKENQPNRNRNNDIIISKQQYFYFVDLLSMEHSKVQNERDPELRDLFNILAVDDELTKTRLIKIINEFELPIDIQEFFGPIGNQERIRFPDFCTLFKSKSNDNNMYYLTFTSSFHNIKTVPDNNDLFPISIKPK